MAKGKTDLLTIGIIGVAAYYLFKDSFKISGIGADVKQTVSFKDVGDMIDYNNVYGEYLKQKRTIVDRGNKRGGRNGYSYSLNG